MFEKEKDPEAIKQHISHKPIDYEKLNRLSKDFRKRFTPQQELLAEQAFWSRMSNPTSKSSDASPVKINAPKELPKVSLVNESLKKLKFHLAKFDNVVKIRTTPDARTEGEWGFEHTKDVFNNEIIPFLKSLKDIFNVFDRDLLNEIMEVFKDQFDSIKKTCVRTKEQSDSLIDKLNLKSTGNEYLKAQIQDKVFVITSLKNDLRKLKGKEIVDIVAQTPSTYTIVPGMFKLELKPLAPSAKKVAVTPKKKVKKVRFAEPLTSSSNIKQVESSKISDSNTPVLSPTGLKCSTSNYGSKPKSNKKNDWILQTPSRNRKNKVEVQPWKVNKKNRIVERIRDVDVKHSLLNGNSEPIYATCNKSMFDGLHDMCLLDFVENWKPKSRTFAIVGNSCPLTRITSANVVPLKKTTSHSVEKQKSELKVYSRKPKNVKNVGSSKKAKIVESKNANHLEPNHTWGSNATNIPSSSSLVMTGCPDCSLVSGLQMFETYDREPLSAHELYLEVAFRKNTCFISNLEGVDLLSGSRDTNLYTISLDDMLKASLIGLLSKASKTKSWLWHRRLSHLKFACALGKSKKSSHQPKAEDTNQEKLYILYMDLCGPMRIASINGKSYILVIVKDYTRFTWVRFIRTKDEVHEAIIKCIKNIQVRLNATVRNVQTDNGTEFINQTLREFYENVGISHQTSVAHTSQQNDVVERQN
ncbi:retrovirus-related pol polyprotein from transposon TNT 1-94 [Tanacetum coccineum]|uniref:Retrovirus-related pol polyprotein from transposon TNT 1-94 n=1 Tax=Tanacetum coccineum TaxID=301880 RepID=A0ABQ4ZKM5_9ASTR